MITIFLDTAQGVVIQCDEGVDPDDEVTKYIVEAVASAADRAYREAMGIEEVLH